MASTPFIILCAARTGSTMLRHMLNSHPDICCHGEVMAGSLQGFVGLEFDAKPPLLRKLEALCQRDPVAFMREFVLFGGEAAAVGFKIKYEELVLPGFAGIRRALQEDSSIQVIHLLRQNRFKRVVSKVMATRVYGFYNLFDPAQKPEPRRIAVTPTECEEDFRTTEAREAEFRAAFSGHRMLEISYESLVNPASGAQRRVQEFLGVRPAELKAATVKINPERMAEVVENLAELRAHFAATPWQAMFADDQA
jgi:LPS sulfotransferase NodH